MCFGCYTWLQSSILIVSLYLTTIYLIHDTSYKLDLDLILLFAPKYWKEKKKISYFIYFFLLWTLCLIADRFYILGILIFLHFYSTHSSYFIQAIYFKSVSESFIHVALLLKESLRIQQNRVKTDAQMKEQQERQLRESLQTQGINSFKHMHQLNKLEETKRKQEYVLSYLLSSATCMSSTPTPCSNAWVCFFFLCVQQNP